jgi:hypothetical protein
VRFERFCSLTAFAPQSFAIVTIAFACSSEPWWLWPISAMT